MLTTIFISIPWFHPAFRAGGPVQSVANLVSELKENVQYKIFCGNTDLNNTTLANIETGKWVYYNDHTQVWYAKPGDRSSTLVKLVEETKPQVLFIIGLYSWHFNMVPLLFCKVPQKIISVRGMLHPGALTQKKIKKKFYLGIFRLFRFQKRAGFHATDVEEKKIIKDFMGADTAVVVAGNFPRRFAPQKNMIKEPGKLHLISIALISPMKNHLLVLESLLDCKSAVDYHIYGPVKDMEYWQQCLLLIKKLPFNVAVHYYGEVQPPDVEACLIKGHVFILPSKSENFGHAFYEALTAGKPVISSRNTPWQHLEEKRAGINVDLELEAVKNAIHFFVAMDQDEYTEWSDAAVLYAASELDMEGTRQQYREMFHLTR